MLVGLVVQVVAVWVLVVGLVWVLVVVGLSWGLLWFWVVVVVVVIVP